MTQEHWIESVLNSSREIKAVEPNPFLLHKIQKQLEEGGVRSHLNTSFVLKWAVAASVLITLNMLAVSHSMSDKKARVEQNNQQAILNSFNTATTYNY